MINSLEEAISREEEMAKEQEKLACSLYERQDYEISKICIWCASEHQQLAEWLRELNKIKHLFSVTEKLFRANFRDGLIDVVDGYDILFSEHKQLREIFEEVNADE